MAFFCTRIGEFLRVCWGTVHNRKTEASILSQSPDALKQTDKMRKVTELPQQLINWGLCLLLSLTPNGEGYPSWSYMISAALCCCYCWSVRKLSHSGCDFLYPCNIPSFEYQWYSKLKTVIMQFLIVYFVLFSLSHCLKLHLCKQGHSKDDSLLQAQSA